MYGTIENPTSIDLVAHQRADDVADAPRLFHYLTLQA